MIDGNVLEQGKPKLQQIAKGAVTAPSSFLGGLQLRPAPQKLGWHRHC
jgi:hypothetical protein